MKRHDFSKGKRGAVLRVRSGKTRITIRLDDDVLEWFKQKVDDAGDGSYQSLINEALRRFMETTEEPLEETLRRVIREEVRSYGRKRRK